MNPATKILIVEDDALMAENVMQSLTREGYIISGVARNLLSAVEVMKKNPADIALIDITLDGPEDGVLTARELTKIKWIPIIYVTGDEHMAAVERSMDTNPAAFLKKPLRMKELIVQIDLALHNFNKGNFSNPSKLRSGHVLLRTFSGQINVKQDEIVYIQAERSNSRLFLTKGGFSRIYQLKPYQYVSLTENMGFVYGQLSFNFHRLSRSLVINLDLIDRIDTSELVIAGHVITIPDGAKRALLNRLGGN
ncbi:response regulator transcription factor [Dyadobacter frigoris]|uniref:DNA-binding response regulator n=1 Tax=Dyadobacter frigoris TaxID=2576211 RepID=A0A4U6D967_9BACT|nr:response regulator [Dyadobacter frigoris]TKT93165.1 DNA-binding response regulator [Dyadobacter frigoris]GLU54794.1 hypothetical protein Dfri01_42550 [Dyadobacter frigoris]